MDTTATSVSVTGLDFRTSYTFSVRANNSIGYSDSVSVMCTTNGEGDDDI